MAIRKTVGAAVLSLALVAGLSGGAASAITGSATNTGPGSWNKVKAETKKQLKVKNNNIVHFNNSNWQTAHSGEAKSSFNTRGGSATSGSVGNANDTSISATVNNASGAGDFGDVFGGSGNHSASLNTTGPLSHNKVVIKDTTKVNVENNNHVNVSNHNSQRASSGDATVSLNTIGGDATSGDATNTNTTSVSFDLQN